MALLTASTGFAAIDTFNFASPQQESDYHSLTESLRCPQCQNNSIADSNATIAVDMRAKVFELLEEGKSKQDVVNYMVERYGNFVTYDPPLTVATVFLWVIPALCILGGVFFVLRGKHKLNSERNSVQSGQSAVSKSGVFEPTLSQQEQQRLSALLNDKNKESS
ncbi:cytochrome c-type biogenesis protein [Pasteurellaceae bacterium LIM206]|nr:cytochrome c-type biogenesis protein [Pasteurellaceae bacterium LIM206]